MLAVAGLVILIGTLTVLPWALLVRRRCRALVVALQASRIEFAAALGALQRESVQIRRLWRPWRQLWRLARHPLLVAAWRWDRRRRST
jgi:hypothetical protein